MSARVWSEVEKALQAEGAAVLVSIIRVDGSAPRESGARLVMRPSGGFRGTIGGGELEWRALAAARALLEDRTTAPVVRRTFALGPELGQCCGGRTELLLERFTEQESACVSELAAREARGPFVARAALGGVGPISRTIGQDEPSANTPAARLLENGFLEERFGETPRTPLCLFGAGHVGRAMVLALAPLPFAVTWIDPREDAFPAAVPGNVSCQWEAEPVRVLEEAPRGAFVLVMTYSHALDLEIVERALSYGSFGYVGLIGSATKRTRFERRMRQIGMSEERLASLVCPIGIRGISSREPAAIAAATVAELLIRRENATDIGKPAVEMVEKPVRAVS